MQNVKTFVRSTYMDRNWSRLKHKYHL